MSFFNRQLSCRTKRVKSTVLHVKKLTQIYKKTIQVSVFFSHFTFHKLNFHLSLQLCVKRQPLVNELSISSCLREILQNDLQQKHLMLHCRQFQLVCSKLGDPQSPNSNPQPAAKQVTLQMWRKNVLDVWK